MPSGLTPEQVERLDELSRRVNHVMAYFANARKGERSFLGFNESIRFLRDAVRGKLPTDGVRRRIHPLIEIGISLRLEKRGVRTGASADDIGAVLPEVAEAFAVKRGRPADTTLSYAVQGLMVAWKWATGADCKVRLKENATDYRPRSLSRGADLIVHLIQEAEPRTSASTILRFIFESRNAIKGKSFMDYFPFYGGKIDPQTGAPIPGPGLKLEAFIPAHPIYCSVGPAK